MIVLLSRWKLMVSKVECVCVLRVCAAHSSKKQRKRERGTRDPLKTKTNHVTPRRHDPDVRAFSLVVGTNKSISGYGIMTLVFICYFNNN